MTRLDVKRGDTVIEVYGLGQGREQRIRSTVTKVGPKWISTARGRYQRDTGYGEFGWSLHTPETLAEHERRDSAIRTLRAALDRPSQIATERLEAAAAALVIDEGRT